MPAVSQWHLKVHESSQKIPHDFPLNRPLAAFNSFSHAPKTGAKSLPWPPWSTGAVSVGGGCGQGAAWGVWERARATVSSGMAGNTIFSFHISAVSSAPLSGRLTPPPDRRFRGTPGDLFATKRLTPCVLPCPFSLLFIISARFSNMQGFWGRETLERSLLLLSRPKKWSASQPSPGQPLVCRWRMKLVNSQPQKHGVTHHCQLLGVCFKRSNHKNYHQTSNWTFFGGGIWLTLSE